MAHDIGTNPLAGSNPVGLNNRDIAPDSAATDLATQKPVPTGGTVKPQSVGGPSGKAKQNALMAKLPKKEKPNNQAAINNNNNNNENANPNNNLGTASVDLIAGIGANIRHAGAIEADAAKQVAKMADDLARFFAKSQDAWGGM